MIELRLAELAQEFWNDAGEESKGDLETAIAMSLPIVTASISQLTVYKALDWLGQKGVKLAGLESVRNRPLRACLIAYGAPRNYILWDNTDSPADQLFSLAHEVAHFLLDFEQPRQKASRHLGPQVLQVFDGFRQPTFEERLHGLLEGVQVKAQHHFMERDKQSDVLNSEVLEIESRADLLALELLAPHEQALPLIQTALKGKTLYSQRLEAAEKILIAQFKLAPDVARPYADQLLSSMGGHQSFQEWLRS